MERRDSNPWPPACKFGPLSRQVPSRACSSRFGGVRTRLRGHERTVAAAMVQPYVSASEASGGQLLAELRRCLVLEQVGVDGQRHPRVGVTEHARDLDVGEPERERVRGERVPKIVQADRLLTLVDEARLHGGGL